MGLDAADIPCMMCGVDGNDTKKKIEETVANNSIIVEVEFSESKVKSILQVAIEKLARYIQKITWYPAEFKSTDQNSSAMYDVLFNCTTQRGQWSVECFEDDRVYWLCKDRLERACNLLCKNFTRNLSPILNNIYNKEYKDCCDNFLQLALFDSIKY